MKNILTLILIAISYSITAQNPIETVLIGDTVVLNVSGQNGSIQWEESTDSLTWANIAGGSTVTPFSFIATSSPSGKKYYRAKITNTTICPNSSWYSEVIRHKLINTTTEIQIGNWFHGGYVFANNLITPQTNQHIEPWGCPTTLVATAVSTTNGAANTSAILSSCPERPIAANVCGDSVINGYSDWFLPAKDQLNEIYLQRNILGIPSTNTYWSSSQNTISATSAIGQSFSNGFQGSYIKTAIIQVRCARSYSSGTVGKAISYTTVTNQPSTVAVSVQPVPQTMCSGGIVTLSVVATGTPPYSYQWRLNGNNITGANSNSYSKSGLTTADEGMYTCIVTNLCNSDTSDNAELKVIQLIANAGTDVIRCDNTDYQINATASTNHVAESGTLDFQWSPATGLSNTTILNPIANPGTDITYTLSVSDQFGCSVNDLISFTYPVFLTAVTQTPSQVKSIGENVTLSFTVTGSNPLYQWKRDGISIPNANTNTYSITNLRSTDAGTYSCVATNDCNSIESNPAILYVVSGHLESVLVGDTIVLTLLDNPGSVQWQQSEDSLTWNDIVGATTNIYQHKTLISSTNKWYYRAKITNPSICLNSNWYSSIIRQKVITGTLQLQVGDWYKGGKVFYVDGSGGGLVSSETDQSTSIIWGCSGMSTGANNASNGALNTTTIVANCLTRPIAASLCDTLTSRGYTDWFLPSRDQIGYLCNQRVIVGRFSNNFYWSSTETSSNNSRAGDFSTCAVNNQVKTNLYRVRCVRAVSAIGKTYAYAASVDQPVSVSISSQPIAQNICLGSNATFTVTTEGTAPFNYLWKKDGNSIGVTSDQLTINNVSSSDQGIYTCDINNLCTTIESNGAELKVIELDAQILSDNICPNHSTQLQAVCNSTHPTESGSYSYTWSPATWLSSTIISNPVSTPDTNINYFVTITDEIGCTANAQTTIIEQNVFQNLEICLVSVDSISSNNLIIWDKPVDASIKSFLIYRDTANNAFGLIGERPYDSLSLFIDTVRNLYAANGDPNSSSWRYKIAVKDTCDNISYLSLYHQSIFLQNNNGNFNWSQYQIEGQSLPVPALNNYLFQRDNLSDGNYTTIQTLSASSVLFTDPLYATYQSTATWRVITAWSISCEPTKTGGHNSTRSNVQRNFLTNSTITNNILNLKISPNPTKGKFTLQFTNEKSLIYDGHLSVSTVQGDIILQTKIDNTITEIDISNQPSGIYFINVTSGEKVYHQKLVKE